MVTQSATKTIQVPNLARSAIAPLISAGVITANISWNAAKTRSGIPYTPPLIVTSVVVRCFIPAQPKPPQRPLFSVPKATEKP